MPRALLLPLCIAMLATTFGTFPARAVAKNWNAGTGNWNVPGNWSPVGVPADLEAVNIVFADLFARTVTYNVSASSLGLLSIDQIGAGTSASTLSMPSNNSLTATGIVVGGYDGAGPTTGRGALNQSAGTITTGSSRDLILGFGAGSTGTYTLSGGGLVVNFNEYVGLSGTGTFNHTAGSHTINAGAGIFSVGRNPGSNGTYNLGGSGALVANTSEYVGNSGTGVFNQTGGTNTINGAGNGLYLGFGASGMGGTYNLTGGTVTVPEVFVGYSSTAGQSSFLITGAGSTVNATNLFVVGREGNAGLTLADGGTLAIGNGTRPLQISTVADLGTLRIGNGGAAGVLQASAVQFGQPGVLEFNHTGNLTFATPISGPGFVDKRGAGTTTLSGTNSYTGDTYIGNGTLAISADNNLGAAPPTFDSNHLQFGGGTLRATQDIAMAVTRGIQFNSFGGTIEVDATKTLSYVRTLSLSGGPMTKTGAGTLYLQNLSVGDVGSSALNVTGGTLNTFGDSVIGSASNVSGVATVSGPGTTWATNTLTVGDLGNGTLEISGGGKVTTGSGFMARSSNSAGTATVRGADSTWNIFGSLAVGEFGDATLNIEDQALVHVADTLYISSGIVNLSGGTLHINGYERGSFGTFNFNSGTIQLPGARGVGTDVVIAEFFGAVPAIPTGKGLTVEGTATLSKPLTIDGGRFKANSLVIGAGGALDFDRGLLELTGGTITGLASLTVPTGGEFRAGGVQSLRITGAAGSTITATGNLTLGNAAAVNGFGTQGTLQVGANSVTLIDANDVVFDSLALATLGNAGSPGTLNAANGLTLDFGGNVTGVGAINTPNNVAKPLINNGHITGNSTAQRITLPGYVKGVGTFDNVNFTGTFSPGLSSTSVIIGNVAFSPTSTLAMELGGTAPGSGYDQILSSAALALDGTLQVSLINGFSPTAGQWFNLFDWASTSGTFDALQLPTLAGALAWNTSQLYTTGVLSVIAPGLPGDYNNNNVVDAADYVVWRKNNNTATTLPNDSTPGTDQTDYAVWRAHYGETAGPGAGGNVNAAVPEPATAVMLLAGILAVCRRRCAPVS